MSRLPLRVDELLGIAQFQGRSFFFGGWLADWILDYPRYDPYYEPQERNCLRGGLDVVRPDQGAEYIEAMSGSAIDRDELAIHLVRYAGTTPIRFLVDFDKALFVNGFHEVPVEDYVPDGWTAVEDDPMAFVSDEVKALWNQPRKK